MDDKSLKDIFGKGLHNLEDTPDPGTWESIQARMKAPRKPRRTFYLVFAAAAVIGTLTYMAIEYTGVWKPAEENAELTPLHGVATEDFQASAKVQLPNEHAAQKQTGPTKLELSAKQKVETVTENTRNEKQAQSQRPILVSTARDTTVNLSVSPTSIIDHPEEIVYNMTKPATEQDEAIALTDTIEQDRSQTDTLIISNRPASVPELEENRDNKRKLRFAPQSILVSGGPNLTYYTIEPNAGDEYYLTEIKNPGIFANERLGWRMNIGAEWKIHDRLKLFTGIVFQKSNFSGVFNASYFYNGHVDYYGDSEIIILTPEEGTLQLCYQQTNQEWGGVVNLLYTIRQKKLNHYVGAGINFMRYESQEVYLQESSQSTGAITSVNLIYGLEYPIHRNLYILAQPMVSFELSKRSATPTFLQRSSGYYLGLQIGAGIRLSRKR